MSDQRTPMPPRDAALRVARRLQERGHETFFAGGCVRDRLLGIEPEDYDVATDAKPEEVCAIFPNARGVGAAFGVILVGSGGRIVEVATFRSDGAYLDARHPVEVTFGSAREDAQRRDFTINGLFERPEDGEIVDMVGGRQDIEAGILRAIGDPEERFQEDHLRMLRAVRFTARFGLKIDPATGEAIASRAANLQGISRERIGQELRRMFAEPSRGVAAGLLERFALDREILGPTLGDAHGIVRVGRLPADVAWVDALVAWMLDRGVDGDPATIAEQLVKQLVLSNQEGDAVQGMLSVRQVFIDGWDALGVARRKRLLAGPHAERALVLLEAEDPQRVETLNREIEPLRREGVSPPPLIRGTDLLAEGFTEGPHLGTILEAVYDAQLEGRLCTHAEALEHARTLKG